jgi:hypothetical protein
MIIRGLRENFVKVPSTPWLFPRTLNSDRRRFDAWLKLRLIDVSSSGEHTGGTASAVSFSVFRCFGVSVLTPINRSVIGNDRRDKTYREDKLDTH